MMKSNTTEIVEIFEEPEGREPKSQEFEMEAPFAPNRNYTGKHQFGSDIQKSDKRKHGPRKTKTKGRSQLPARGRRTHTRGRGRGGFRGQGRRPRPFFPPPAPLEEGSDVVQDQRRKFTVNNFVSPKLKKRLESLLPHLEIIYTSKLPPHCHILAGTCRDYAARVCKRKLRRYSSGSFPIIDVGLSKTNIGTKTIHGCECGADVYTKAKVKNLRHKYSSNFLGRNKIRPRRNPTWTFCTCPPSECNHATFGSAMFVHSIYEYTPQEVFNIIWQTKNRVGVSVHHTFPLPSGFLFRRGPGSYELTYKKTTSFGEPKHKGTKVHVWMTGHGPDGLDDHRYDNYASEWLLNENRRIKCKVWQVETTIRKNDGWHAGETTKEIYRKPRPAVFQNLMLSDTRVTNTVLEYWLTWTSFYIDSERSTVGAFFRIVKAIPGMYAELAPNQEIAEIPRPPEASEFNFENAILRVPSNEAWVFRHVPSLFSLIEIEGPNSKTMVIPKQFFVEGYRFMQTKYVDASTRKDLGTHLRKYAKQKFYEHCPVTDEQLIDSIPTVRDAICERVTNKGISAAKHYNTASNVIKNMIYNRSLDFEGLPRFTVPVVIALLVMSTIYGVTFFITIWTPITFFIHFSIGIILGVLALLVGAWLFGPRFLILVFAKRVAASSLLPNAYSTYFLDLFVPLIIILFVIYLIKKCCSKDKYRGWYAFKRNVEILRQTYAFEGPVPFAACINSFETIYDVSDIEMAKGASLKIKHESLRVQKPRPGSYLIGPGFSYCVPLVYSTSQHNLITALIARSLCKPPFTGELKYWKWATSIADSVLLGENGLVGGLQPHSRVEEFELGGVVYTQPEFITWEYYISRYPPNKRRKIEAVKKKLAGGERGVINFIYKAFVKREKQINLITYLLFVANRPRTIQGGSDEVKVLAGQWFLAYSYALKFTLNPTTAAWYCSGYSSDVFNFWIDYHLSNHISGTPWFFYCDFSKYDLTQNEFCIKGENQFYRKLGFSQLEHGEAILKSKMFTKGYGDGLKYNVHATRKSGDNDTSSGNSRNTFLAFWSYFVGVLKLVPLVDFVIAFLGDDNMTIFSEHVIEKFGEDVLISKCQVHMRRLGFSVKIGITNKPIECEFLSLRWYQVGSKLIVGKKPGRVLSKIGWFLAKTPRKRSEWLPLLKATMISYLPTCNHVPFLRVYISTVLRHLKRVKDVQLSERDSLRDPNSVVYEPTSETFVDFEELYGLDRTSEENFERHLDKAIRRHGLSCIINSPYIEPLLRFDCLL